MSFAKCIFLWIKPSQGVPWYWENYVWFLAKSDFSTPSHRLGQPLERFFPKVILHCIVRPKLRTPSNFRVTPSWSGNFHRPTWTRRFDTCPKSATSWWPEPRSSSQASLESSQRTACNKYDILIHSADPQSLSIMITMFKLFVSVPYVCTSVPTYSLMVWLWVWSGQGDHWWHLFVSHTIQLKFELKYARILRYHTFIRLDQWRKSWIKKQGFTWSFPPRYQPGSRHSPCSPWSLHSWTWRWKRARWWPDRAYDKEWILSRR